MNPADVSLTLATIAVVTWFGLVVLERPSQAPIRSALLLVVACGMLIVSVNGRFTTDPWVTQVVASFNRGVVAFGGALLLGRLLHGMWERRRHDGEP